MAAASRYGLNLLSPLIGRGGLRDQLATTPLPPTDGFQICMRLAEYVLVYQTIVTMLGIAAGFGTSLWTPGRVTYMLSSLELTFALFIVSQLAVQAVFFGLVLGLKRTAACGLWLAAFTMITPLLWRVGLAVFMGILSVAVAIGIWLFVLLTRIADAAAGRRLDLLPLPVFMRGE